MHTEEKSGSHRKEQSEIQTGTLDGHGDNFFWVKAKNAFLKIVDWFGDKELSDIFSFFSAMLGSY